MMVIVMLQLPKILIPLLLVDGLEVACFTNTTGDVSGHNVILHCVANQIVVYLCEINSQLFQPCKFGMNIICIKYLWILQIYIYIGSDPHIFRNLNASNPVVITVNATAQNTPPVSLTLTGLIG